MNTAESTEVHGVASDVSTGLEELNTRETNETRRYKNPKDVRRNLRESARIGVREIRSRFGYSTALFGIVCKVLGADCPPAFQSAPSGR